MQVVVSATRAQSMEASLKHRGAIGAWAGSEGAAGSGKMKGFSGKPQPLPMRFFDSFQALL